MEKKAKQLTAVFEDNSVETTTDAGLLIIAEDCGPGVHVKLRVMNMDENAMSAATADLIRICVTEIGLDPHELLEYALGDGIYTIAMEIEKEALN